METLGSEASVVKVHAVAIIKILEGDAFYGAAAQVRCEHPNVFVLPRVSRVVESLTRDCVMFACVAQITWENFHCAIRKLPLSQNETI